MFLLGYFEMFRFPQVCLCVGTRYHNNINSSGVPQSDIQLNDCLSLADRFLLLAISQFNAKTASLSFNNKEALGHIVLEQVDVSGYIDYLDSIGLIGMRVVGEQWGLIEKMIKESSTR